MVLPFSQSLKLASSSPREVGVVSSLRVWTTDVSSPFLVLFSEVEKLTILFIAWSAPSAIGLAGVGVGGQAGAEMTDFLIVLNSRSVSHPLDP